MIDFGWEKTVISATQLDCHGLQLSTGLIIFGIVLVEEKRYGPNIDSSVHTSQRDGQLRPFHLWAGGETHPGLPEARSSTCGFDSNLATSRYPQRSYETLARFYGRLASLLTQSACS